MRIIAIVAGTNVPSNSEALADAFLAGAASVGADTEKLTLRDKTIEPFSLRWYEPTAQSNDDFPSIQATFERADGFIVASPIWNFNIPSDLKTVIDRCGTFSLDTQTRTKGQWKDKPFYLIFTGGAPAPAWAALFRKTTSGLAVALQYFGGAHVGTHYEPRCMVGKGVFGLVVDKRPASLAAMNAKGAAFARLVRTHVETGKLPARLAMKRRFYEWGQTMQRKFL